MARKSTQKPLNSRSQLITAGVARSPNRAMLRAVGFGDNDFVKPIVGVANGHSNMNPCNAGIQPLVDRATAALKEAGLEYKGDTPVKHMVEVLIEDFGYTVGALDDCAHFAHTAWIVDVDVRHLMVSHGECSAHSGVQKLEPHLLPHRQ